jgi:hypothetical protein
VVSDSITDCVIDSAVLTGRTFDEVGEAVRDIVRPPIEDSSSTVTGIGFIFVGVPGFDLCKAEISDMDLLFPLRCEPPFLLFPLKCEPPFRLTSLSFLLISSPLLSYGLLVSAGAAAGSSAVNGGLGGAFITAEVLLDCVTFPSEPSSLC